jgi:cytochrome b561
MKTRIVGFSATAAAMLALLLAVFCLPNVAVADESGSHEHEHKFGISLFSFVKPLGMCALGSAMVTFGAGLFRRKLGRRFLKVHKTFAWLTVGFALCHGTLVLVLF